MSPEPASSELSPTKQKIEPGGGLHPLPRPHSHGRRIGNTLFIAGSWR